MRLFGEQFFRDFERQPFVVNVFVDVFGRGVFEVLADLRFDKFLDAVAHPHAFLEIRLERAGDAGIDIRRQRLLADMHGHGFAGEKRPFGLVIIKLFENVGRDLIDERPLDFRAAPRNRYRIAAFRMHPAVIVQNRRFNRQGFACDQLAHIRIVKRAINEQRVEHRLRRGGVHGKRESVVRRVERA